MPSLPGWVASRVAALRTDMQPDPATGKWRPIQVLPLNSTLMAAEREMLTEHSAHLQRLLTRTPLNDPASEEEVLVALTKMMSFMPSAARSDLSSEANGEAFIIALEDLPAWATVAAITRWHRGDVGNDQNGKPYDCHWCPAPADIRRVAYAEMHKVRARRDEMERLLSAVPPRIIDEERRRKVGEGLLQLAQTLRASLVGRDGSGEAVGETPAECADCGTQPRHDPA
jgi:hypothetical protein